MPKHRYNHTTLTLTISALGSLIRTLLSLHAYLLMKVGKK